MNHRMSAAVIALIAAPALARGEELTIVSKVTVNDRPPTTATQYLGTTHVRSSDGENDTIMDLAGGRFIVVNHRKKEYYEFTAQEMAAAMQRIEQQMSGPAGGIMEKMMGGKMGEVAVRKGGTRKIAGYDCTDYTYTLGENMRYDVCSTQGLQPGSQYYDAMKSQYAMMGPMGRRFEKLFAAMKQVKGFPVAMNSTVNLMTLKVRMTSEATEIRKGPIAASAFAVPAGYKKKDSPFKSSR